MPTVKETIEGYTHGIVSINPPEVQCDECGHIHSHEKMGMAAILSGILFAPAMLCKDDKRRLCRPCATDAGWDEYRSNLRRLAKKQVAQEVAGSSC